MLHLDPSYIGKVWPTFMWTVTIVSALGCCMGFHEFVWFMSVGYGFAVMCIGIFHLIFGFVNGSLTSGYGHYGSALCDLRIPSGRLSFET